jgi:ribosomal protein S18 acetylase RimI-like enzyme
MPHRHLNRLRARRRLAGVLTAVSGSGGGAGADADAGVAVLDEAAEVLLPEPHFSNAGSLTVRRATDADVATLAFVTSYGFASPESFASIAERVVMDEHGPLADEQTWGAFEGDRAVAQLLAHEWKISGGITCDVAAVSGVGTLPEFRRLGLLRTMMGLLFKDMMERGQPVAALQATQAAIYQRYGYSEAVRNVRSYSIDTVDVAFLDGNGGSCTVGREPLDLALEPELRRIYEDYIAGRACCFGWDSGAWRRARLKKLLETAGAESRPPVYCAIARNADGKAQGYCLYTTKWGRGPAGGGENGMSEGLGTPTRSQKLEVTELCYSDMEAFRSLWTFLGAKPVSFFLLAFLVGNHSRTFA